MDDTPYEPSDSELALIVRELIRIGNRKRLNAEEVTEYILSTVSTYSERLEQMVTYVRDGISLDYTYGVWRMARKRE